MKFSLEMLAGVTIITLCAIVITFTIPVHAEHQAKQNCVTVQEDVEHLEKILAGKGAVGKFWLWSDSGYSISIAASPSFNNGTVIFSFYDGRGCLMPHPRTGAVRTTLPISDKVKAYIAKSKLIWSNTDRILLTSAGYSI